MYIPNNSLFGPYNATCMYVFRAGCLALDNKLACSSLGRPPLLLPVLSVILCVRLRLCGLFSIHFGMFVGQLTCEPSCGWALWRVASDTTRRHSPRAHFLILWRSQSFLPLCGSVPRASGSRVCCRCISWACMVQLCIWLVVVSCSWLLQWGSFLVEGNHQYLPVSSSSFSYILLCRM